jgi:phage antirepressor YoqD-like protein
MNLKELLKKGGATLTKDLKALEKNEGYMVSLLGYEKTYNFNQLKELEQNIKEYQKQLKNNEYIGLWVDNNIIYLDISKHYIKKEKAKKAGIKNKQLAIYDLRKNKSIYLTKKAYIIYKYNKMNNDFIYYKEYYNLNDIIKDFNLSSTFSLYHYIINNIEDNITNLLNDRYIIVKENVLINEL